ncbi:UNVERIFIED_CONTAM: hypothetical protein PYX00_004083 [Menopon gallinae]|uniref:Cilia- and flagella-associated protein 91 n=1 Tax=Menopon gallinae TaxID=328185 RepID=A0AAW2I386_9NEOP
MLNCRRNYPVYNTLITGTNIPPDQGYRPKIPQNVINTLKIYLKPATPPIHEKNAHVQTMYRDSEAQTGTYVPDIRENTDPGLEIFTLGWLSIKNGLPAGMRESVAIERARQRRAWEHALPVPIDRLAMKVRRTILDAMDLNEWNYREVELAALNSVKMQYIERSSKESLGTMKNVMEDKLLRILEAKIDKKDSAIYKLRSDLSRNIRKIMYKKNHIERKMKKTDVITDLSNHSSEMYGPQSRYGYCGRRRHEVIPKELYYWNVFSHMQVIRQKMHDVYVEHRTKFDFVNKSKPKKHEKDLCQRETRWTVPGLINLYENHKKMRLADAKEIKSSLLKVRKQTESDTVIVVGGKKISDEEEDLFQACLVLQKVVKGRAIQAIMSYGKAETHDLIKELMDQYSISDLGDESSRKKSRSTQRSEINNALMKKRRQEILNTLVGKNTGEVLDFLAKELQRLQYERSTHALALMATRERHRREAEEAGRRQREEQRRREHEEMWKQMAKIYQNSADIVSEEYGAEIITNIAAKDARMAAEEYAKKIDMAANEAHVKMTLIHGEEIVSEELVADLVHNFALPEVEKQMVRKRLAERQKTVLSACHDEIYSKIEKLCHGPRTSSGLLKPLMRPHKHRVPRTSYVKFLKLKRLGTSGSNSPEGSTDQQKSEIFEYWSTGYSPGDVVLDADQNNV